LKWVSPSPKVWRFTLNKETKWSDGVPLAVEHVISGIKLMNPNLKIKAMDLETLEVELPAEDTHFPWRVSNPIYGPRRNDVPMDGKISLGPYRIESQTPYQIRFSRNPHYLNSEGQFNAIDLKSEPSEWLRIQMWTQHEADIVENIETHNPISGSPTFLPEKKWGAVLFHPEKPPFSSIEIRKAFQSAIDTEELRRLVSLRLLPALPLYAFGEIALSTQIKFSASPLKNLKKTTLGIASLVPQEVAENLKQQWAKNLQVLVEMVPPPSTAPITVMEWDSEGGPNSFNYRNEDITQGLILPLYQKAQPLWIQPSVLSNPANPMIYWQN
jgi:ABC-type oligopeptide transport system substrate-binding subunit